MPDCIYCLYPEHIASSIPVKIITFGVSRHLYGINAVPFQANSFRIRHTVLYFMNRSDSTFWHIHCYISARIFIYISTAPSKHETLTRCWFNVGPASQTLAQHQTNTVLTFSLIRMIKVSSSKIII